MTNTDPSLLVVWAKDNNDTVVTSRELLFDPSADWHNYEIVLNEGQPDANEVNINV